MTAPFFDQLPGRNGLQTVSRAFNHFRLFGTFTPAGRHGFTDSRVDNNEHERGPRGCGPGESSTGTALSQATIERA